MTISASSCSKNKGTISRAPVSGFTLLEVIIIIAVIAILAGLIAPLAVNRIDQQRFDSCRRELQNLKMAIVGDQQLLSGGMRNSFGFVGDLGMVPRSAPNGAGLQELLVQGGLPSWQFASGVWWGWRGPYISNLTDPWGHEYAYADYWSGGGPAGQHIIARIWSYGPNGQNDSGPTGTTPGGDDLYLDILSNEAFSLVSGNTFDNCGAALAFDNIVIAYPARTALQTLSFTTTADNPVFSSAQLLPLGVRFLTVSSPAMQQQVYLNRGPQTVINLRQPGTCF